MSINGNNVNNKIIIDIGTQSIKYGFSDSTKPFEMPTIVGYPNTNNCVSANYSNPDVIVFGDAALKARRHVKLIHPIKNGQIKDIDSIEMIINHIFSELQANPKKCSVLITEPIFAAKCHTNALRDLFYHQLDVHKLAIIHQPVLSLCAHGKSTGLVIEIGEDLTQIAPIYEGELLRHAAVIFPLSGSDLTNFFQNQLNEIKHLFVNDIDMDNVRITKEKLCFVALNDENDDVPRIHHEVSPGKHISIGKEKTKCPEALFNPSLLGLDSKGLPQVAVESILKCDETIHEDLFKNIVLSGGSSQFPGLQARLEMELRKLTSSEVKVINQPTAKFSSWLGGSNLAQSPGLQNHLFSRETWEGMEKRHSDSATESS